MARAAVACLLLLVPAAAGELRSGSLDGLLTEPFPVRERFAFGGFGLLTPGACCVELVPDGEWALEAAWMVGNTLARSPEVGHYLRLRRGTEGLSLAELRAIDRDGALFVADGEFSTLELTARRGLRPGLEISATVPLVDVSGGGTDSLKAWVDGALGVKLNGRDRLARNRFLLYLRRPTGEETYLLETPGVGLGDLRLGLLWRLPVDSRRWAASLRLVAELPTGDPRRLHGSGSADLGVNLAWTRSSGRRRFLGHLGVTHLGAHTFLETRARTALSTSLGVQLPLGRSWATTLRWYAAESVLKDFPIGTLAEPSSFLEVELVRRTGNGTSWHVAFSDNLPFQLPVSWPGSASDFAIQFGARQLVGRSRAPSR